jgi:hypothetical protein
VLIELILDYQSEQSCATSAIFELSLRNPSKAKELAGWLTLEIPADQWLKSAAQNTLDDN